MEKLLHKNYLILRAMLEYEYLNSVDYGDKDSCLEVLLNSDNVQTQSFDVSGNDAPVNWFAPNTTSYPSTKEFKVVVWKKG